MLPFWVNLIILKLQKYVEVILLLFKILPFCHKISKITTLINTTMTTQIIYSIGVLVEVDDAKTGYIIEIDNTDTSNVVFKINYTVGNESEENVSKSSVVRFCTRGNGSRCWGVV